MLQVSSNLTNINGKRPGNVICLMQLGKNISYFQVMKEYNVKMWVKSAISDKFKIIQDILLGQGTFLLSLEVMGVLMLFIICALRCSPDSKFFNIIK